VPITVDFRLSHAQKSLSVYCKHLWCMCKMGEPATCPVDRGILRAVYPRQDVPLWTEVDKIDTHKEQLRRLQDGADAKGQSLAVWELLTFQAGQP